MFYFVLIILIIFSFQIIVKMKDLDNVDNSIIFLKYEGLWSFREESLSNVRDRTDWIFGHEMGRKKSNYAWYRISYPDHSLLTPSISFLADEISEVYYNHKLIFSYGDMKLEKQDNNPLPLFIPLPPKEEEETYIYVRVFSDIVNIGFFGNVVFGELSNIFKDTILNALPMMLVGSIFLFCGMVMVSYYYFIIKNNKNILYSGMFLFLFGLYYITRSKGFSFIWPKAQIFVYLEYVSLLFSISFLGLFCSDIFRVKFNILYWVSIFIFMLGVYVIFMDFAFGSKVQNILYFIWIFAPLMIVIVSTNIFINLPKANFNMKMFSFGFLVMPFGVVNDVLHGAKVIHSVTLGHWGILPLEVIFVIFFIREAYFSYIRSAEISQMREIILNAGKNILVSSSLQDGFLVVLHFLYFKLLKGGIKNKLKISYFFDDKMNDFLIEFSNDTFIFKKSNESLEISKNKDSFISENNESSFYLDYNYNEENICIIGKKNDNIILYVDINLENNNISKESKISIESIFDYFWIFYLMFTSSKMEKNLLLKSLKIYTEFSDKINSPLLVLNNCFEKLTVLENDKNKKLYHHIGDSLEKLNKASHQLSELRESADGFDSNQIFKN